MDVKRIDVGFNELIKVYHLADLHFRLVKRHSEYKEVLNRLYDTIGKFGTDNSLICFAGDLYHNKIEMSPESVDAGSEFLKRCADLCHTILIPGNHDLNLNNKNRLDTLSPIVKNLNHPKLHYFRESGVYRIADTLFVHMSVLDEPDTYLKIKDIPPIYRNDVKQIISLFHGPIHGSQTDIGYTISNRSVTVDKFNGSDIVICGDIHKHQIVQEFKDGNETTKRPIMVYPGSTIIQNHGEDVSGHGFCVWNIPKKKFMHVELQNDFGFYTIEIRDGKLTTDLSKMPKKARLRVKCFQSDTTDVKRIISDIKRIYNLEDITYIRADDNLQIKHGVCGNKVNLNDILDVNYQNGLILEYLKNHYVIDDETLEIIKTINKDTNAKLPVSEALKNIKWVPKKFEFDNMFAYGEGNVIDFTKMSGIMGLFAKNKEGKSSVMDALSFCIFDKSSRAFKACNVMNNEKMSFRCKFTFEINGVDYFIERSGTRNKKGDVPVDVEFYKIENGTKTVLAGEARRGTNDIIRDYLGSYDEFILTALAIQNGGANFIDMGQTDRKDLLAKFMGLDIFDKLYSQSAEDSKDITALLKNFDKDDFTQKLADANTKLERDNRLYLETEEKYNKFVENKNEINSEILELTKKLINLQDVPTDIDSLEDSKKSYTKKISDDTKLLGEKRTKIKELMKDISDIKSCIKKYEKEDVEQKYKEYSDLKEKLELITDEIEKFKTTVSNKIEKLKKLDKHEYDPNCKYCMNNIFVKDAIKTRGELNDDKTSASKLVEQQKVLKSEILKYPTIELDYADLIQKKKDLDTNETLLTNKNSNIKITESDIENNTTRLDGINKSIDLYNKSVETILNNKKVQEQIDNKTSQIGTLDTQISKLNDELRNLHGSIELWKSQINDIEESIKKAKELESKNEAYQYYLESIKRDGIPYELISKAIPLIEGEVNNILSQIVEFGIVLNMDGKNVNTYIVYDDKTWPLELASGMERFISSLAIRVALTNVSSFPRPTFLALDEGFGSLDTENMSSMHTLFSYLKNQYDFIILISHVDMMKDITDNHIEIRKENGFSKIEYQ